MTVLEMGEILEVREEGPDLFWMLVHAPDVARSSRPGQFVHLACPGEEPLLRRPISIGGISGERLELLIRVAGKGTRQIVGMRPGEKIDILGPLGRGFTPPHGRVLLVAGGIGLAPLRCLAQAYPQAQYHLLYGGQTASSLVRAQELKDWGLDVQLATEDGSQGLKGRVTQLLRTDVDHVYACGPNGMLQAVGEWAQSHGLFCELSLENHMGCGLGACLACVCQVRSADGQGGYARVCKDGPVFKAEELLWGEG